MSYIPNPKMKNSGLVDCIPQTGRCPMECDDCFFQSGRSYLEPLEGNLPNIPNSKDAVGRVVAMNRGGHDSNTQRDHVEGITSLYEHYFFNTAHAVDLEKYPGPVVLTVNLGPMTDSGFIKLNEEIPRNLMFVRVRTNAWNLWSVSQHAVNWYTDRKVRVVLTFMAYCKDIIPDGFESMYTWEKRTINSYWVLLQSELIKIENAFRYNSLVYTCSYKNTHNCSSCGNCIREYFRVKEEMRNG